MTSRPLAVRFMTFVRPEGDCWLWDGALARNDYGRIRIDTSRVDWAYRVAYELFVGPIPLDLELDHLCRNHACVNPAHLEPVTHTENMRRGSWAIETHCRNGHSYDEANTAVDERGARRCRACAAARARRFRRRKRMLDSTAQVDLGVAS